MKLKCYLKGAKCPTYKHEGMFRPDNATITRLLPDLKRCANCMACSPPKMPDFRDDLQQAAAITLFEKGPLYDPTHHSHANFGTFIRPKICVSLINAKNREITHLSHFAPVCSENDSDESIPMPQVDSFVAQFIWENSVENFEKALPKLLQFLTPREGQVLKLIRNDKRSSDIAKSLNLSKSRISALTRQVEQKLKQACMDLRLIE